MRRLQATVQKTILAEAVRKLKAQYTSMLITVSTPANRALRGAIQHDPLLDRFPLGRRPARWAWIVLSRRSGAASPPEGPNEKNYLGSHVHFGRYLKNLETLSQENTTREITCADDGLGYRPERTAWIAHLLSLKIFTGPPC
ncbi:MAG: hypothetical protein MPW13_02785 [Candidatus Manganitrophus sp.]|nr:hypothetical protein [Candidatus Manganitrophus sp.]